MTLVYLGLGSNLNDRAASLAAARERLASVVRLTACSAIYESEPVGYADQPLFLNQAIAGETQLLPSELLAFAKAAEADLGRRPSVRNGPRAIDIDLLLYDDWIMRAAGPIVPHPGMGERSFVLAPLCEIAPDLIHPLTRQTIGVMWEKRREALARSWLWDDFKKSYEF